MVRKGPFPDDDLGPAASRNGRALGTVWHAVDDHVGGPGAKGLIPEEYAEVYHLLQTEAPVFFTALNLFGLRAASVHTELDLSLGEPTGEGYDDRSLEALIVRARREADGQGEQPART